jgi:hypothetical protein
VSTACISPGAQHTACHDILPGCGRVISRASGTSKWHYPAKTCDRTQQTAESKQQRAEIRQQPADSREQTANSREQRSDSSQQTAESREQRSDSRASSSLKQPI